MTKPLGKYSGMANLVVVLLIICVVAAGLLGLVNHITADGIAEIKAEKTASAMREVMPDADSFDGLDFSASASLPVTVFEAKASGEPCGYVVQVAPSGFGRTIDMMVGVDLDGAVIGVAIISMSETSGLGDNAKNSSFRDQYKGKSGSVAVTKDGGDIDALTGATVTSRAVSDGVNAALEAVTSLRKGA